MTPPIYDDPLMYQDPIFQDYGGSMQSHSLYPQSIDPNTFKQRNDPQELLQRLRLSLMNAFIKNKIIKDEETGEEKIIQTIAFKKNTKPKANKQGIEDIISYTERLVNSHTVQGNLDNLEEYRNRMRHIANDITMHFMTMRKTWGININDIDPIISTTTNLIDLFLTRTLFNEERKSYSEGFKETTSRDIRPENKPSFLQKVGSFFAGKR